MIIYNITSKVSAGIAPQWLEWFLKEHIPQVMATKCFTGFKVVKLLTVEDDEGPTYAVQYNAPSLAEYQKYMDEFENDLTQQSFNKWGNHFISFSTIMEVIPS